MKLKSFIITGLATIALGLFAIPVSAQTVNVHISNLGSEIAGWSNAGTGDPNVFTQTTYGTRTYDLPDIVTTHSKTLPDANEPVPPNVSNGCSRQIAMNGKPSNFCDPVENPFAIGGQGSGGGVIVWTTSVSGGTATANTKTVTTKTIHGDQFDPISGNVPVSSDGGVTTDIP